MQNEKLCFTSDSNKGCRMYKGDIYLKGHDIKKLALCIYMSRP